MHDIDFLPAQYREKHARRQSQPWQIFVAVAILCLLVAAVAAQRYRRGRVESDLAMITPVYEAAVHQQAQLAATRNRLKTVDACAALYTYLRHPWPRTQLLHALVAPLPEAITLQQIQISPEALPKPPSAAASVPADPKAEETRLKGLTPAQRDLATLRGRLDAMQTVVVLSGTATDPAALYRYIAALDATEIFEKAELDCFNSVDAGKTGGLLQFRAVLAVQPGYGQPGGPTGPEKRSAAGDQLSAVSKDSSNERGTPP